MGSSRERKTTTDVGTARNKSVDTEKLVRIGFVRSANTQFKALPSKIQSQLLRKLKELGLNPALGKPLVGELKGCRRISFGRIRCVTRVAEGVAVVLVIVIAQRRAGSSDDPYQLATEMLASGEAEVQELLEHHVRAFLANHIAQPVREPEVPNRKNKAKKRIDSDGNRARRITK